MYFRHFAAQLLGRNRQQKLGSTRTHSSGLGRLGSAVLQNLVAAGVCNITANDPQILAEDNLNGYLFAGSEDVGKSKAKLHQQVLSRRPYMNCRFVCAPAEAPEVDEFFAAADHAISCANTISGRKAAASKAIRFGKALWDVAVADCRKSLAGFIKVWLPENAEWSACPACYYPDGIVNVPRGEGLLAPVIATTAGLAAHMIVQYITGLHDEDIKTYNYFELNLATYQIAALANVRRDDCDVCGPRL